MEEKQTITFGHLTHAKVTFDALLGLKWRGQLAMLLAEVAVKFFEKMGVIDGVRDDFIKAYAKHTEKGELIIGDDGIEWEDEESFEKEMTEALGTEADVDWKPIALKMFRNHEFTPIEMLQLTRAGIIKG
jgi:hypothetical protein